MLNPFSSEREISADTMFQSVLITTHKSNVKVFLSAGY